jgi:hypothetical protein
VVEEPSLPALALNRHMGVQVDWQQRFGQEGIKNAGNLPPVRRQISFKV